MRQLVVLVGLPGSGKTAYHQKKSEWAVVSRDVIRQTIFGHSYEPEYEEAVERIFSASVVEAVESSAATVCIDDLNLLRKERKAYVELGRITHREAVAIVMPYDPVDELYRLAQFQLDEMKAASTRTKVSSFSRDRFDAMLRCYEAVQVDEGFARVVHEEALPLVRGITMPETSPRRERKRREEKQNPIPLFAS
jgi:predicted kinase